MDKYIVIFFLLGFNTSLGCTCINSRPLTKKEYRGYDTVVKVKILDVVISEQSKKIVAEVIEFYKGMGSDSIFIVITESDPGMCGIEPKIDETWLIYSFQKGHFNYTDQCTKSKKIRLDPRGNGLQDKLLKREIRFLERRQVSKRSS